jgi:hypothetical protein
MFNGAFAKILEAQKITIRLLANFANRFDALDTQGSIHPRCELQLLNWHFSGSSGVGAINRTSVVSRAGRLIAQGDELAAERGNPGT